MGKKAAFFQAVLALASMVAALPTNADSRWNMHLPGYAPGTHPDREDSNIDSFLAPNAPSTLGDTIPMDLNKPSVNPRVHRRKLYQFSKDHSPVKRDFFRDDTGRPVHPMPAPSSANNEAPGVGKRDFFRDDTGRPVHNNPVDNEDSFNDILASSLRGSHGLAGGPHISSQDIPAVHYLKKHHHPMHQPFAYLTERDNYGPPPDHLLRAHYKFNEKWDEADQQGKMQYLHDIFADEPLTEGEYIRRYKKVFGYPYDSSVHINDKTFGNPWKVVTGTH